MIPLAVRHRQAGTAQGELQLALEVEVPEELDTPDVTQFDFPILVSSEAVFIAGVVQVPIVVSAILYDLGIGDSKVRPDAEMGYRACQRTSADPPAEGNAGAGTGCTVGKIFVEEGTEGVKVGTVIAILAGEDEEVSDIFDGRFHYGPIGNERVARYLLEQLADEIS